MEALEPQDPRQVGAYRLVARLGGGGMGQVYLGRTVGGRTVAVKLVRREYAADEDFRRRFRQEVAAARRVGGRGSVPVLDADTEGPVPWVATGYVAGPDLRSAVRTYGPLPAVTIRALGMGLAEALSTVHNLGLVHRDVKPPNVLLALDGPRLIDFGIARALDGETSALTRTGMLVGSPGYVSPEQAAGRPAEPASDVFALGAVLAFAATGRAPFGEEVGAPVLLYRVLHEEPDLAGLPEVFREVVSACLAKDPARRPGLGEVGERLRAVGAGEPGGWLPPSIAEAVARLATQVLDFESPEAGSQGTFTATMPGLPMTMVAAPMPQRRRRRRPLVFAAVGAAAMVAGVIAWAVPKQGGGGSGPATAPMTVANSPNQKPSPGQARTSAGEPEVSAPVRAQTSPSQSSAPTSASASTSTSEQASAPGPIPSGFIGSWSGTVSFAGQQTAPLTLRVTIHQSQAGSAVVAEGSLASDQTCSFTDDLAATASGRLTLISGSFNGDPGCSAFAAVRQVFTLSSASSATVTVVVPAVDQADSVSTLTGTLVRG